MEIKENKLYLGGVSAEDLVAEHGSPLYVYEEDVIRDNYKKLYSSIKYKKKKFLYACKANTNLAILQILKDEGCGIDAVSPGEVYLSLKAGFKPEDILFTGNNVRDDEMEFVIKNKVMINVDSISQLKKYGKINPNSEVSIRINPEIGAGHHEHVITGGPESKFGIYQSKIEEIKKIAKEFNLKIVGVHMHVGSNFLDINPFLDAVSTLLGAAEKFEGLKFVDFGGGVGIPYEPGDKPPNLEEYGNKLGSLFENWCKNYGKDLILMTENGRYYVAHAGHLLVTVNTIKETPKYKFVGTDSGFNHLVRPALYSSYHEIINASSVEGEKEKVNIAGNICESGDLFAKNREITKIKEGDVLSIENSGAYGFSMSSNYNSRPRLAEVLVKGGKSRLIREREDLEDLLKGQIF